MRATRSRRFRPLPVRPAGWWCDALLLLAAGAVTVTLAAGGLVGADLAVREWVLAHRPAGLPEAARVFNYLGQGGWFLLPLATGLALLVSLRTRSVRPVLPVGAAFLVTYLTIGPLKLWTDRAAPGSDLPPRDSVQIFNTLPPGEYDLSYPSGHVANAIVWYGVIALLLTALTAGRLPSAVLRLIRWAPPVIVAFTTTYLNYHWLTDGLAAIALGLLLDRLLRRVPWDEVPLPGRLRRHGRTALSGSASGRRR